MKTFLSCLLILNFSFISMALIHAQSKSTVAVLHIDTKGVKPTPAEMGNVARIELDKLGLFEVLDRYDVEYLAQKNNLELEGCYGKLCLTELGKSLKVDKILTGSVEAFPNEIVVTMRFIDVRTEKIERTQVTEFLDLPDQLNTMVGVAVQQLFEMNVDTELVEQLTKKFDSASQINLPSVERLNLSGPRMGVTIFTGEIAEVYQAKEADGGFDAVPVMFQFGYQFELKYINQGNFQALVEFIPTITGLDQGKFIPSFAILNGFRNNNNGWEFAFGPSVYLAKEADGYFDENGKWNLESAWEEQNPGEPNPFPIEERLDSRGATKIKTNFVFAVGRTFKSGRLNIPINAFFVPNKDGHRFGLSVGFNIPGKK